MQPAVAEAMAGCVGSGLVSQLGWVASVIVDAPPPQSVSDLPPGDRLKSQFCSSHWATLNALSLQSPGLAPCPSLVQSQVQPSQVSGRRFNRAPREARPAGSAAVAGCHHPGCWPCQAEALSGISRLLYTWEFPHSVGNKDQSGNAALTHRLRIQRGLQSWVVLTAPS